MSREEEEEVLYEEEEVLWAKIRGYPWWPAFVDKVHPNPKGECEYTVFFFGDNTQYFSSKLGASKLRKFYDFYTEFYPKARSHRKLMASILKAEEKLAQNDQNVEIFEVLRNTMVSKKPLKGKSLMRNDSRLSEQDAQENREELPDLNKSKTYAHNREKREIYEEQSIPPIEKMDEEIKQQAKEEKIEEEQPKVEEKVEIPPLPEKKSKQVPAPALKRGRKSKKQKIYEQEFYEDSVPEIDASPKLHIGQMQLEQAEPEPESSESEDSDENQKSAEDNQYDRKNKTIAAKRKPAEVRVGTAPRKRGRPKKQQVVEEVADDSPNEAAPLKNKNRLQKIKRKIQKNRPSPKKVEMVPQDLSDHDLAILQNIKQLSMNRDRLIDYLCSIEITIANVKQILDLDVSNILHDGEATQRVIDLLELLKAAILYKYFPEDVKHRKKYEKLSKKRNSNTRDRDRGNEMVDEKDEQEREAPTEKVQENEKEKGENTLTKFDENQIRKKTIIKIEKFLRAGSDLDVGAREKAVEIEGYFERADPLVKERYKNIAMKVLRNLKERTENWKEVLFNLQRNAYD